MYEFPDAQQTDAGEGGSRPLIGLAAYRGCWVALIGDQVAGVGADVEAATIAARHNRPRERVTTVLYVAEDAES